MKKDCVFYNKEECSFKQKKLNRFNCFNCISYYKNNSSLSLKEWYILANTNKNFIFQFIITLFTIILSAYVVYDKKEAREQIDKTQMKINSLENQILLLQNDLKIKIKKFNKIRIVNSKINRLEDKMIYLEEELTELNKSKTLSSLK